MEALQAGFMEAHARAVARASIFGILLYAAAIALMVYVGYLFVRLRANARSLQRSWSAAAACNAMAVRSVRAPGLHPYLRHRGAPSQRGEVSTAGRWRAHLALHADVVRRQARRVSLARYRFTPEVLG
jgi:hypothetical protein